MSSDPAPPPPAAQRLADELDEPAPAAPADEPERGSGATASERAAAQTAAELSEPPGERPADGLSGARHGDG